MAVTGTVIDRLVVELGLDPNQFKRGSVEGDKNIKKLEEQFRKSGKEIEKGSAAASLSLLQLRNQVLELLGAFLTVEGIKSFVSNLVRTGLAIDRVGRLTDQSIASVSEWGNVAEQTGGSAQDIQGSMLNLTSQLQNFSLTGESQVLPWFRALGISLVGANKQFKTAGELMLELADHFHRMDPARALAVGQALGFSPATINLLIRGRQAVEALLEAQKRNAPTAADIAAEVQFNAQLVDLEKTAQAAGRALFTDLYPALTSILTTLKDLAGGNFGKMLDDLTKPGANLYDKLWNWGWNNAPLAPGARGEDVGHAQAVARATGNLSDVLGIGTTADEQLTKDRAMTYLQARGLSAAQAAAMVGSLQIESGLNAQQYGDNGAAYGLAQWHKDRQVAFARYYGHDIRQSTPWEQLDFALYEMRQGREKKAGRELFAAVDLTSAMKAMFDYERPKNLSSLDRRMTIAKQLLTGGTGSHTDNRRTATTTVHGGVHVHTASTSPEDHARAVKKVLEDSATPMQANYGPN